VFEEVVIRYFHPQLKIGLQDIRNAWLLSSPFVKLTTAIHRGNLVYRVPGSGIRISFRTLRKGLLKKRLVIRLPVQLLPF
jgi:hypothetical protein